MTEDASARGTEVEEVLLSTVTPVYRGADVVADLAEALDAARRRIETLDVPLRLVEAIFVDDGSQDGSAEVLAGLCERYDWIHVITLSRNFGQHPATSAGILHSSGDWVATLDEDLQHRPDRLVPLLARAVEEGADLVYARPIGGVHRAAFRDAASRGAKRLVARLAGDEGVREFNSFRMIRGSVARAAAAVSTHDTYFDVALGWFTNRTASLPMELHDPRPTTAQGSGYGPRALLSHARRMLISSDVRALRLGATVGIGAVLASVTAMLLTVGLWLLRPEAFGGVRGWLSLFVSILFFGGLTALLSGIAIEYLASLLRLAYGKPTFFVVDRGKDRLLAPLVGGVAEP